MRSTTLSLALALLTVGCRVEGTLVETPFDLVLEVDTPTYGEFLGDAPATVTGRVTPINATLTVEGEVVDVDDQGRFTTTVPIDHAYRIVDVEASLLGQWERVRVPVFQGHDPVDTWPGGLTLRLTPSGLAHIGRGLGAMIDQMGWEQMILDQLPALDLGLLSLTPTGLTHDPTVVELLPAPDGLDVLASFRNVDILYDATFDIAGNVFTVPVTMGYDRVGMGARATPDVDAAGMLTLALSEGNIDLGEPDITIGQLDGWLLELLLSGLGSVVEPLGELLLDTVLGQIGTIELGGPYVFETDLLGTSMEVRLSDVFGDPNGLGAGLGVGINEPAAVGPLAIPTPHSDLPEVHAALGLHEGLMQLALAGELLDMLTQDIALPGFFGEVIGTAVRGLPGGDDAPEGEGWCMSVLPMDARVVRLQSGLDPWVVLYLPDVVLDIGVMDSGSCESWLVASLAFEVGLDVRNGQLLQMDLDIPEGAVLEYGADPGWEEDEVVAGLAGFMGTAMDLLGSQFSFDLGDLLGGLGDVSSDPMLGAFGEMDVRILGSEPLLDEAGNHPEGLYDISLGLWEE